MASFTEFYPIATPVFFTMDAPLSWLGSWDAVATVKPSSSWPSYYPDVPVCGLIPYKAGLGAKTVSVSETVSTNPYTLGIGRFLTEPLEAQTIGGTLSVLLGVGSSASAAAGYRLYAAVLAGNSDTVRGVLGTYEDASTTWTTTPTATGLAATFTLSDVDAQSGDRLLLEIGAITRNSTTSSQSVTLKMGATFNHAALPNTTPGATNFTTTCGYVTFSQPIALQDLTLNTTDLIVGNCDLFIYTNAGQLRGVTYSLGSDGEASGVVMADGTFWTPHAVRGMEHYSRQVTLLSTTAPNPTDSNPHALRAPTGGPSASFYVANAGGLGGPCGMDFSGPSDPATAVVQRVDHGHISQSWAVALEHSGVPSMDFMPDGHTLVYTSLGPSILVYDLATSSQRANLVSLPALEINDLGFLVNGTFFRGVRCLLDGTVLAACVTVTSEVQTASEIRHYDADGTLLHSYSVSGQVDWGSLTLTLDQRAFWVANTGNSLICAPMIVKIDRESGQALVTITGDGQVMDTLASAHLCSGGTCVYVAPPEPLTIRPEPIVRERITPHLNHERTRITLPMIQLDLESGVGLTSGQGADPLIEFQLSRDGGHTWGPIKTGNVGKMGEYAKRVLWRQNGQSRDTVFRWRQADPVKTAWLAVYLQAEEGES